MPPTTKKSSVPIAIKTPVSISTKAKVITLVVGSMALGLAAYGFGFVPGINSEKALPANARLQFPQPLQKFLGSDTSPARLSPVGHALRDIFSISIPDSYSRLPAEIHCSSREDLVSEYPRFFDTGRRREIRSSIDARTIEVFIRTPGDHAEYNTLADEGLTIIERMLPIYERWVTPYPCDHIYVNAFTDAAFGSPGFIQIGGANGVNSPQLLGHELTHSFFHSQMGYSWLAEGAAQFLPLLNRKEQLNQGFITPRELYGDYSSFDFTFEDFLRDHVSHWSDRQRESLGITRTGRICDQESDYLRGAVLGNDLMIDLYLGMGQEEFLNAMTTLYLKYRITGGRNSYHDVFRVIQYFTPTSAPSGFISDIQRRLCM